MNLLQFEVDVLKTMIQDVWCWGHMADKSSRGRRRIGVGGGDRKWAMPAHVSGF